MNNGDSFRKRAEELTSQLTLDEKLGLLTTHHQAVERLGLGEFYIGTEVARGFVGREKEKYSTVFPQPIGLAGTFDMELMERLGEIAGNESRAYYNADKRGGLCLWGPTVDMERDPRWGRTEEAYGEDVCLAGEMTAAYTRGLAGNDEKYMKTIPTLKHFCANNNEKHRGSCNAYLPLRLKYEYYYAAFMNAIKYGKARSVMAAYNEINGIPALCNPELESVLKDEWGLWFAVTDGGDFSQTVTAHRYGDRHSETLAEALKAGCDTMTDNDSLTQKAAREALAAGILTEADIDRSVVNTLYARLRLGQLAEDCPFDSITLDVRDDPKSSETCLRAAREQVVLLNNSGLLPVKEAPRRIAVVGALSDENLMDWYTGHFRDAVSVAEGIRREFPDSEVVQDSLWDIVAIQTDNGKYLSVHEDGTVWADADEIGENELFEMQVWDESSARFGMCRDCTWTNFFSVKYKKYIRLGEDGVLRLHDRNIYDWFTRETFRYFHDFSTGEQFVTDLMGKGRLTADSSGKVSFDNGRNGQTMKLHVIDTAVRRAEELSKVCDLIVYCVGNHPVQVAKECFDRATLDLKIQQQCRYIFSVNESRTVTVLISSYPYIMNGEKDLIYTTHAGAHLGTAVAETISGRNNPAGRLAMTWYRSDSDLPDIMDYDIEKSCTTYMYFKGKPIFPFGYGLSYSEFEYEGMELTLKSGSVTANIKVNNISDTDGDEVVQLYFAVPDSAVSRPIKKLCAFERVHIKAGETANVELAVPEHILQIYDTHSRRMLTESAVYRFMAGGSSADLPLAEEIRIEGADIPLRPDCFEAQSFDVCNGGEIAWSRRLKRQYLKTVGWGCTAIYGGCSFAGKRTVKLTASSYMNDNKLYLDITGIKAEAELHASDGMDDFTEYTVELPQDLPDSGYIVINLPADTCLLDISLA